MVVEGIPYITGDEASAVSELCEYQYGDAFYRDAVCAAPPFNRAGRVPTRITVDLHGQNVEGGGGVP